MWYTWKNSEYRNKKIRVITPLFAEGPYMLPLKNPIASLVCVVALICVLGIAIVDIDRTKEAEEYNNFSEQQNHFSIQ